MKISVCIPCMNRAEDLKWVIYIIRRGIDACNNFNADVPERVYDELREWCDGQELYLLTQRGLE